MDHLGDINLGRNPLGAPLQGCFSAYSSPTKVVHPGGLLGVKRMELVTGGLPLPWAQASGSRQNVCAAGCGGHFQLGFASLQALDFYISVPLTPQRHQNSLVSALDYHVSYKQKCF